MVKSDTTGGIGVSLPLFSYNMTILSINFTAVVPEKFIRTYPSEGLSNTKIVVVHLFFSIVTSWVLFQLVLSSENSIVRVPLVLSVILPASTLIDFTRVNLDS